jgi:hypothetical protein
MLIVKAVSPGTSHGRGISPRFQHISKARYDRLTVAGRRRPRSRPIAGMLRAKTE